jgi:hypothetical protein
VLVMRKQQWRKSGCIEEGEWPHCTKYYTTFASLIIPKVVKYCSIRTTTHVDFYDVPFISLEVIFLLYFIIYDTCMLKTHSSPIPCNKRYFITKTYFFHHISYDLYSIITNL